MPRERLTGNNFMSRSDRMINFQELTTLMEECVAEWDDIEEMEDEKREILKQKIRLAELFMLCSIRNVSIYFYSQNYLVMCDSSIQAKD